MTMVSEQSDELSLLASNAAGELFCCDLSLREGDDGEDGAEGEGASEADLFSFEGNPGELIICKRGFAAKQIISRIHQASTQSGNPILDKTHQFNSLEE